jgi:hypothetical protein
MPGKVFYVSFPGGTGGGIISRRIHKCAHYVDVNQGSIDVS